MVQRGAVKRWRKGTISNRTDRLATVFPRGSEEREKMEKLSTINRSDRSRVNKFLSFIRSKPYDERRPMTSIPIKELAPYLATFFRTVKAHSGEEFSEGSLVRLRTSLERHLKEHNYPGSITMSPEFELARQAFKEKQQMLKSAAAAKNATCIIPTIIQTADMPSTDIAEQLKTEDISSLVAGNLVTSGDETVLIGEEGSVKKLFFHSPRSRHPTERQVDTSRKTAGHVKQFQMWLRKSEYQDFSQMKDIPPELLDTYLASFFSTIRRQDGEDYSHNTFRSLRDSLERHLREVNYPASLTLSVSFPQSQLAYKKRVLSLKYSEANRISTDLYS